MKYKQYIFPTIIAIICCGFFINPQHTREFLSTILIGGYLTAMIIFKQFRIPTDLSFYSVIAYGVVITMSYFSTMGSSMNYRPLMIQYLGILTFIVVYTNNIKHLKTALIYSALGMSSAYITSYFVNGYKYFDILFMHRNVAGMFFAICIPLCFKKHKALLIPLVWALLLTGSRGAVGALVIAVLINLIIHKKWLYLTLLVFITAIACLPFTPFGERLWSIKIFNGRDWFFKEGIKIVSENVLFGCGIGNLHYNSLNNGGSHNFFFSLHSSGGVLAVIFFFIPFVFIRKCSLEMISICVYLIYSLFSECAANTPPNNIIYWALLAYALPKNMTEIEHKDKYGIIRNNKYFNLSIRAFSVFAYLYIALWSVKHFKTNLILVSSLTYGKAIAVPLLTNAIDIEPKNFKAYYFRACRYLEDSQFSKAHEDFVVTEHLCPDFGITRKALKGLR